MRAVIPWGFIVALAALAVALFGLGAIVDRRARANTTTLGAEIRAVPRRVATRVTAGLGGMNLAQRIVVALGGAVWLIVLGFGLLPFDDTSMSTPQRCGPTILEAFASDDESRSSWSRDATSRKSRCERAAEQRLLPLGIVATLALVGTAGGVFLFRSPTDV